tara:strand:- start:3991 stop:6291 length:2301 start_codon:yes stop_codon:yes gene_type:complete
MTELDELLVAVEPPFLRFQEEMNMERVKRIANIDSDLFIQHLDNGEPQDENWPTPAQQCTSIKRMCNKYIYKKGEPNYILYTHSNKVSGHFGRKYANISILSRNKGLSIQGLNGKVKGYLCGGLYYDVDMKNAQPSILLYLMKTYYPDENFSNLKNYIKNRDWYLAKINSDRSIAKQKIVTMMNGKKATESSNMKIKLLDNEFKKAQNLLWDSSHSFMEELVKLRKHDAHNKKGKFISLVLQTVEDKLLTKVISQFSNEYVSTLIYDGFHLSKKIGLSKDEIIDVCNKTTGGYGLEWDIKEFDKSLDFIDDEEIDMNNNLQYEAVKAKFEQNHFMINSPVIFGCEYIYDGRPTYSLHNKGDFTTLTESCVFEKLDKKGVLIKVNFFKEWLKDEDKRSYKQLDFSPCNIINPEFYNTFRGFDCELPFEYKEDKEGLQTYINHLNYLVDYDKDSLHYMKCYISDIIQNTTKPCGTAILLKSPQGHGKDMFMDVITRMLNINYLCRTQDIKDVLGNFNTAIKDKVVCVINELEGKDGWAYRDKLKGLITAEHININEKGIKHYTQKNCLRVFIFSNRDNPVEISPDDRRFIVFKSNWKKPSPEYFSKMAKVIDNKAAIYTIYNYFKNFKIDINLRHNRPITTAYLSMREQNINPVYNFISDVFIDDQIDEHFSLCEYKTHKKTKDILIRASDFYNKYKGYLHDNTLDHIITSFKSIKQSLASMDIDAKPMKINGETQKYYRFNKAELVLRIGAMNINPLCEEFADDEFV